MNSPLWEHSFFFTKNIGHTLNEKRTDTDSKLPHSVRERERLKERDPSQMKIISKEVSTDWKNKKPFVQNMWSILLYAEGKYLIH